MRSGNVPDVFRASPVIPRRESASVAGRARFPSLGAEEVQRVFPDLAQTHLPPVLFGFVLAAIFAANLSGCDSQLLVGASGLVRDVCQRLLGKGRDVPPLALVALGRGA
jgi:Na+/proline symporter